MTGFDTEVSLSCCCVPWKSSQTTTVGDTTVESHIDRGSASKFNDAMTWTANRVRGYCDPILTRSFQFTYRCGLSLRVLRIHENGFITAEDKQGDCCSCSRRVLTKAAFLENVSYIKYTHASCLGYFVCCAPTNIEINFEGDAYRIEGEINHADLTELYGVLVATMRKGPPLAHLQKFTGAFGDALTVAPDFVTMTYRSWYACLCPCVASTSVVTVRTSDVAYVKASMATFSKACSAAWEETAEPWFEMKKSAHRVCHEDLAELISWPCSCIGDMMLTINLCFQSFFICLIFPFYVTFACCCRRRACWWVPLAQSLAWCSPACTNRSYLCAMWRAPWRRRTATSSGPTPTGPCGWVLPASAVRSCRAPPRLRTRPPWGVARLAARRRRCEERCSRR